jgi:hypothetical protein
MFGYLVLNQKYVPYDTQKVYKSYYCGTCYSLMYNYGFLSRLLLSYDVTLIAILFKVNKKSLIEHNGFCGNKLHCIKHEKNKSILYKTEQWKRISAISVLLFKEKLRDDINDDNSLFAKILYFIFSKKISKAQRDYPSISEAINRGYSKILKYESKNADVCTISSSFADMMVDICKIAFDASDIRLSIIKEIAWWLYCIDALDDYDKDVKEKHFNPLVIHNLSYPNYVDFHFKEIHYILNNFLYKLDELKNQLNLECPEDKILYYLIRDTIPVITAFKLNNQKIKKQVNKRKRTIWSGIN